MTDTPTPAEPTHPLMPESAGEDFVVTVSAAHALMFDQIIALGMTVMQRLTVPAAEQPQTAGRSIDSSDYAACAMIRAIRELSLAAERIIDHAARGADWQYHNPFETKPGSRFARMAEAIAGRGTAQPPAPTAAEPGPSPQPEISQAIPEATTLPFPARRAKH